MVKLSKAQIETLKAIYYGERTTYLDTHKPATKLAELGLVIVIKDGYRYITYELTGEGELLVHKL